ncbi:MAG: hypothetical protein KC417_09110, partial [Myxococcales bacterium]|nr:hypothetical protein [Myxococcales bacterium]
VLATQNPMDLDYRALSNAGVWCIGRLQTDADRARVVDGITGSTAEAREVGNVVEKLAPRWFLVRNVHANEGTRLVQPRWAMSFLRGPMTRVELQKARRAREREEGTGAVGGAESNSDIEMENPTGRVAANYRTGPNPRFPAERGYGPP